MDDKKQNTLKEAAAIMGRVGGSRCVSKGFSKSGKASEAGRKGGCAHAKKGFAAMTPEARTAFYAARSAKRKQSVSDDVENA